jgi:hypothetical protein
LINITTRVTLLVPFTRVPMGKFASGSPRSARLTADAFPRLDVYDLHRAGGLVSGALTRWQWQYPSGPVTVSARAEIGRVFLALDGGTEVPVIIAHDLLYFGDALPRGDRPRFICAGCDRRVRYLYIRDGRLACQRCHHLAFASRHKNRWSPALRRIAKLRADLARYEAKALDALRAMNASLERDKRGLRK